MSEAMPGNGELDGSGRGRGGVPGSGASSSKGGPSGAGLVAAAVVAQLGGGVEAARDELRRLPDGEGRSQLAAALRAHADEIATSDPNGARAALAEAAELLAEVIEERPGFWNAMSDRAVCLGRLGDLLSGRLSGEAVESGEARGLYRDALALMTSIDPDAPGAPTRLSRLAVAWDRVAWQHQVDGDDDARRKAMEHGVDVRRQRVRVEPDAGALKGLFVALRELGRADVAAGDHARAVRAFSEQVAVGRDRLRDLPDDRVVWDGVFLALDDLAEAQLQVRDRAAAVATLTEALDLLDTIAARFGVADRHSRRVALTLSTRGVAEHDRANYGAAAADHQRAADLFAESMGVAPSPDTGRRTLARECAHLADNLGHLERWTEALAAIERSMSVMTWCPPSTGPSHEEGVRNDERLVDSAFYALYLYDRAVLGSGVVSERRYLHTAKVLVTTLGPLIQHHHRTANTAKLADYRARLIKAARRHMSVLRVRALRAILRALAAGWLTYRTRRHNL